MVAEPEVLAASVESTSDRKVCPELALGTEGSVGPSLAQGAPRPPTSPAAPVSVSRVPAAGGFPALPHTWAFKLPPLAAHTPGPSCTDLFRL